MYFSPCLVMRSRIVGSRSESSAAGGFSFDLGGKMIPFLAKNREFAYWTWFAARAMPLCLRLIISFHTGEMTAVESVVESLQLVEGEAEVAPSSSLVLVIITICIPVRSRILSSSPRTLKTSILIIP
ncbi:hypothetical protein KCU78_g47, partial [Aureobasidium melanogenum]